MLKAFERTLINSSGMSLEQALRTKEYGRLLLQQQNLPTRFPVSTDQGVALRAGHLTMGRLLNTLPEQEAVLEAQKVTNHQDFSSKERALVHLCGRSILRAAKKCLPPEAIALAAKWRKSSADEQFEIVRQLYFLLRSNSQEPLGEMTMKNVLAKMDNKLRRSRQAEENAYLPGLYGKWDKDSCPANCQGKTQMIVAFARLAGTIALTAHPVENASDVIGQARTKIRDMIVKDLNERGLENACAIFSEGITASIFEDRYDDHCFHVGAALRLSDGNWVFLDPNGLCWGKLSSAWNIPAVLSKLHKYKDVLPGMALMQQDGDRAVAHMLAQKTAIATDLIMRSRAMETKIRSSVHNVMELVDCICDSEDLDVLLRREATEHRKELVDLSSREIRQYAAMMLVVGEDNMWSVGAFLDPTFLEERIKMWLTWYHASAINVIGNNEPDNGEVVHPVCEFALPEYSVAVSALNSARFDVATDRHEANRFMARHSFDQTTLSNAFYERDEIGMAARQALQALPFRHPLCQKKVNLNL